MRVLVVVLVTQALPEASMAMPAQPFMPPPENPVVPASETPALENLLTVPGLAKALLELVSQMLPE